MLVSPVTQGHHSSFGLPRATAIISSASQALRERANTARTHAIYEAVGPGGQRGAVVPGKELVIVFNGGVRRRRVCQRAGLGSGSGQRQVRRNLADCGR